MSNEKEPCPLCGALPGDWVDNPHENLARFRNVGREPLIATDPLFMALADLRIKTRVGEKPMLSELPDVLGDKFHRAGLIIAGLRELSAREEGATVFGKTLGDYRKLAADWLLNEDFPPNPA